MLRKALFILFCFAFLAESLYAQRTAEVGLLVGRSYYIGEVNPETHVGSDVGSFTYGGLFRYNLNMRYSLRLSAARTTLSAEDKQANLLFNTARDLSFETKLTDISGVIEFNFLPFELGSKKHFFSPYLFVGLSVFNYDPSTKIGETEIEREETKGGTAIAFPFGPGMKLSLGKNLSLAVEWGFRKTSKDDLDGLPNREDIFETGKPHDNDWYVMSGVMITYRITQLSPCPYYGF